MPDVQVALNQVNEAIFGTNSRVRLVYVNYANLREQDVNANVMPMEMFNALVANIRKHGALESVPLCATREGSDVIEIVSGHHRIRAAVTAGQTHGIVLCYFGLTADEIKAKQLAHNAIAGQSDPEIVKRIFDEIASVDAKMESYIDPTLVDQLPEPVAFQQIDIDPQREARAISLIFLPTEATDFDAAMQRLYTEPDVLYVAHRDSFDGFRDTVHRVMQELNIYSYPTAVSEMARLAMERLDQIVAEAETASHA